LRLPSFANSLLEAVVGGKKTSECTYVESTAQEGVSFFSTRVEFGPSGAEKIHPIGKMSDYEKELMSKCIPELKTNIEKGVAFVKK
jgi:malate dehydrogenase